MNKSKWQLNVAFELCFGVLCVSDFGVFGVKEFGAECTQTALKASKCT